jgi:hypothetical protein
MGKVAEIMRRMGRRNQGIYEVKTGEVQHVLGVVFGSRKIFPQCHWIEAERGLCKCVEMLRRKQG